MPNKDIELPNESKDIELPNESGKTDLQIDKGATGTPTTPPGQAVRGNAEGNIYGYGHYKGPIEITNQGMTYRLPKEVPVDKAHPAFRQR